MRFRVRFALPAMILVGLAVAFRPPGADAQSTRYAPWQDAGAAKIPDRAQQLIDKLTPVIDEAAKARAADPRFIDDLRSILRNFERPWKVTLISDDFADGDFKRDPVWRVVSGRYWVEPKFGLRSAVTKAKLAPEPTPRRPSQEDQIKSLFGAILNQAIGDQGKSGAAAPSQPAAAAAAAAAAIRVAGKITNAFSVRMEFASWQSPGRFEFGPYQGTAGGGYRLVYKPGGRPALQLVRVTSRGSAVIDQVSVLKLEDDRVHVLEWTRTGDGAMAVSVDGKRLLGARDRTYRQAFDGFTLINQGGDYTLRSIRIDGTG